MTKVKHLYGVKEWASSTRKATSPHQSSSLTCHPRGTLGYSKIIWSSTTLKSVLLSSSLQRSSLKMELSFFCKGATMKANSDLGKKSQRSTSTSSTSENMISLLSMVSKLEMSLLAWTTQSYWQSQKMDQPRYLAWAAVSMDNLGMEAHWLSGLLWKLSLVEMIRLLKLLVELSTLSSWLTKVKFMLVAKEQRVSLDSEPRRKTLQCPLWFRLDQRLFLLHVELKTVLCRCSNDIDCYN